mmetsp:Transcript_10681/g.16753  ORF Transcript_10681/g.16753 Transcript_10681/m.16753 type:complete len:1037 (-) Transcript_10681:46-3156(-)
METQLKIILPAKVLLCGDKMVTFIFLILTAYFIMLHSLKVVLYFSIDKKSVTENGFGVVIGNCSEISFNSATEDFDSIGGVVSARSSSVIIRNVVTISNQFAFQGGVISQVNNPGESFTVSLSHVENITSNRVDHSDGAGAIIYAVNSDVTVFDIYGGIFNNTAHNGDGLLIYAEDSTATFTDSNCDIYDNFAFKGGVIAANGGTARFTNFVGDIYDNHGFFSGSVLHCSGFASNCEISNFVGDIHDLECGNGCVIFSEGSAVIDNFVGDIKQNNAHFDGGVIDATTITVSNVDGDISKNFAEQGSGGVFFSNSTQPITLSGIRLIEGNFAKNNGGVAFSTSGAISLDRICSISGNVVEDGTGSVAWTQSTISVTFSTLSGNMGQELFSPATITVTPFTPLSVSISIIDSTPFTYVAEAFPVGGSNAYSYFWTTSATTKVADNINLPNFSVDVVDDSFCTATASLSVPNPTANAGSDEVVCPSVPFVLGGNPSGSAGIGSVVGPISYDWSPANTISGNGKTDANPTAFIVEETIFTLVVTDVATGLQDTDRVTISPFPLTVNAGDDVELCAGDSVTIGGSPTAFSPGSLTLRYTWEPSNGLSSASVANPTARPSTTTTYTVTVSSEECRNLRVSDQITITVNPVSSVKAIASPVEQQNSFFICKGDSVILGGESFGVPGPIFYSWSPSEGLDNVNIPHPEASPSVTTTYTLTVFSEGQCSSDTDTVTVQVSDLGADAGFDILTSGIIGGVPTAIAGKAPYSYSWTPSTGLSSTQLANPFAKPGISTAYEVTVTDANNCQQSDTVNIVVRDVTTSGYSSIRVSFFEEDSYPVLSTVSAEIRDTLAAVLSIPPLAIDIQTNTQATVDTFDVNLVIYQFGKTGDELVDELMTDFGCQANVLPCVVNTYDSLLREIGWDYLEFLAPSNVDGSFSINSLNTLTFSTYDPPPTFSFSTQDDDIDFSSIFTSLLLDDDNDENLSDFISGNDDDDEGEFNLPSNSFAPNTYLSSLIVNIRETESSANSLSICFSLFAALIFVLV